MFGAAAGLALVCLGWLLDRGRILALLPGALAVACLMSEFGIIGAIQVAQDENEPLGIIDPEKGPANEQQLNPLSLEGSDQMDLDISLRAFPTGADAQTAELTETTRGALDYTLRCHVLVERQNVPDQED